jgi:thiopeptide-type bacteriocin biosynthesis protein
LAEDVIDRFFFVRFSEGSNHLRLRVWNRDATRTRQLRAILIEEAESRRVEFVAYEPELGRYGGDHGIEIAEEFFDVSSRTCLALLEDQAAAEVQRRGYALTLFVLALSVFLPDRAIACRLLHRFVGSQLQSPTTDRRERFVPIFDQSYDRQASRLQTLVEQCWLAAEDAPCFDGPIDVYWSGLLAARARLAAAVAERSLQRRGRPVADWQHCVEAILPSYIHMTNNRLGISVTEEAHIARLIVRTLDDSRAKAEVA